MGLLRLRPWNEEGRELDEEDFAMMNLPRKFHDVSFDRINDGPWKDLLGKYIENLRLMRTKGLGLFLIGDNGRGKSSAAAVIAKLFRSHGQTALFARTEELKQAQFDDRKVADDYELWEWAHRVDVLVIDDLGKEYRSKSGYTPSGS